MVQFFGAVEIEKSLVDGQRFDQRRQVAHHLTHFFADADVFLHVWFDDDRFGAGLQSLIHGHGGAHAANAGDVATG